MTTTPLRTYPDLVREARRLILGNDSLSADVLGDDTMALEVTLIELAKIAKNRTAVLAILKDRGVEKLGERQKLTNALAKAERANLLKPCLDERTAIASGLAAGKLVPYPHAEKPASHLANATALKDLGNTSFKASSLEPAIDLYADAILAASAAIPAKDAGTEATAVALLVSLHSNTAACYLKLERWMEVVASATCAIDLDATNAKALYRRGIAYTHLDNKRGDARKDLVACVKLDPKNRDAREALAAIDKEKAAQKAAFSEAFKKEIARDESEDTRAKEAAAAEAAAMRERVARDARERAKLEGVDLEAIDKLYETLASEGVNTSDAAELNQALIERGADMNESGGHAGLEAFARYYTRKNPTYGGVTWGSSAKSSQEEEEEVVAMPKVVNIADHLGLSRGSETVHAGKKTGGRGPSSPVDVADAEPMEVVVESCKRMNVEMAAEEEINTDGMYSMSSWGSSGK